MSQKDEKIIFIELHLIQNFSPSNLNRDDTNTPKTCQFGGVRRARISSQCIKRAIRTHPLFEQTTAATNGTRTKWLTSLLRGPLLKAGKPEEIVDEVISSFANAYAKGMDGKKKTKVLLYLSPQEVQDMVDTLLARWDEVTAGDKVATKAIDEILKGTKGQNKRPGLLEKYKELTHAPDIALFGRMLASRAETNLDAACQVAHAISTHAVSMEMDFFSAVDDWLAGKKEDAQSEDEAGAGMIGTTLFNSPCYYRYARIDWHQLYKNLNKQTDLALRTVEGFLRAMTAAVPTGMQNAYAANNSTNLMMAVVRRDGMGWSLANAFEKPVRATNTSGLIEPSIKRLDVYWGRLCERYGTDTLIKTAVILDMENGLKIPNLQPHLVKQQEAWFKDALEALKQEVGP